ncbi:hypothetical protein [Neoasaia chiangmaiensis]|nr:hypothetical protein [Neoasaia chiangmaiensis]
MTRMNDRPEPELHRLPPNAASEARGHGAMATWLVIAASALLGVGYLANHGIAGNSAPTAAPVSAQGATQNAASAKHTLHVGAQFSMIAPENAAQALKASHFSPDQQQDILAAVKRRDVRLVQMPIADATGQVGQVVSVSSAGLTQNVSLTGKLQSVLLPIRDVGEVTLTPVTTPRPGGMQVVALSALGPELLPNLSALDQQLILDVIVQ